MKLIILAGEENSGKTTILKSLTTALKKKDAILSKSNKVGNPEKDEINELDYCGKKVVICTKGDDSNDLKKYCEQFKSADILISATRKTFRKTNQVALSFDDMSTIVLINPQMVNQRLNNELIVGYLLQLINIRLNH